MIINSPVSLPYASAHSINASTQSPQNNIIYVHDIASGQNNGSIWTDAFTSLQSALDVAQAGDEIWVAGGTYLPSFLTDPADPRSATFSLKNGIFLYGGFKGNESAREERNWLETLTILSGDIDQNDFTNPIENVTQIVGENVYHVVTINGANVDTILDGFTISAGYSIASLDRSNCELYCGGGILVDGGNPTIINSTIKGNFASAGGGIMITNNASPKIINSFITDNNAFNGGGTFIENSFPVFSQTTISRNLAARFGGGIFITGESDPSFTNVTIFRNDAVSWGGGLFMVANFSTCSGSLINATFTDNNASGGSELLLVGNSQLKIKNSIIWGLTADNAVIGDYNNGSSFVAINSDIRQPAGKIFPGEENINSDPGFGKPVYSGYYGGYIETFSVLPGSRAIDAVPLNNCTQIDGITPLIIDQRGISRPQGKACDMGAFEGKYFYSFIPVVND